MQSLKDVFSGSLEDSIDDLISTFIFSEQRKITTALQNHNEDLSLLEEAKNNFIQQSLMGLAMWGYQWIMKFIEFLIKKMSLIWAYIVTGKLTKKLTSLKTKNIKGKKALNILSSVIGADKTAERIEVAKIVNSNFDSVQREMQNVKSNKIKIDEKMLQIGFSSSQLKNVSSQEDLNLYLHKTKTSTWTNTQKDKKLFEKITGQVVGESSSTSWGSLVTELNKFSEFAKDTEGNVYNLTNAILSLVSRSYLAK